MASGCVDPSSSTVGGDSEGGIDPSSSSGCVDPSSSTVGGGPTGSPICRHACNCF